MNADGAPAVSATLIFVMVAGPALLPSLVVGPLGVLLQAARSSADARAVPTRSDFFMWCLQWRCVA
jgi:hypothetical protein